MVSVHMNPWRSGSSEAFVAGAHGTRIRPFLDQIGSDLAYPDSQRAGSSNNCQSATGQWLDAVFTATCAALDRLNVAIILVSSSRRIALTNSAALRVLAQQDALCATGGVLRLADHSCRRGLDAFLNAQPHTHMSDIKRSFMRKIGVGANRCFLVAEHLKVPASCAPFALILIYEPHDVMRPDCEFLVNIYGLTKTESKLVVALFMAPLLSTAAGKCSITLNTAKTHLKRIFDKCGVHSKAELLRMLAMGPQTL